jgi:beta-phosphoglucomutase-like phosphatase (HAD superfamily)
VLKYFGVPDAERWAERYAAVKQEHLVKLMEAGEFTAYPDAIRFVLATKAAGIPIAAASSSKNADLLLRQVRLDDEQAQQALADAGADLVVRTLDEVSRPALAEGRLALKTEG